MKYPSTGARFEGWLDSGWIEGTTWRESLGYLGRVQPLDIARCAFVAGVQSEMDEIIDLQKQIHFWKQACDDAHNLGADRLMLATHNLGADRLMLATNTLIDVREWIQTGAVDGVYFDEQGVIEAIQATLEKLA